MSAGAFKNIFLSLHFTMKHTRQRLFALVIHVVMQAKGRLCVMGRQLAGAVETTPCALGLSSKGVERLWKGLLVARPIVHNVGGLGVSLKCEHKMKLRDAN